MSGTISSQRRTGDASHVGFLASEMSEHIFLENPDEFDHPLASRAGFDRDLQGLQLAKELLMFRVDLGMTGFEAFVPRCHWGGGGSGWGGRAEQTTVRRALIA